MATIYSSTSLHSPKLGIFTSLLLILFCLFKFDRYQSSQLSTAAAWQQVVEQIQTNPPCYNIPRLAGSLLVDEDPATAGADVPPPCKTAYRCALREFAATVFLRIRLHDKSIVNVGSREPSRRPPRAFPKHSDEPSDSFSS